MANRNQLLNDSEESIRTALDGRQSSIWTAIPGIIQSVDLTKMTCTVQPTIQGININQNGAQVYVNLPLLIHVPIVFPGAGGFIITFPLAAGDEVLVVFSSRCIDSWWQNGGIGVPMEARMHDLSDGFAIPGPKSVPNVPTDISTTDVQIRNSAGTAYVGISPSGKISLVSPSEIDITGNLKVTGTITASVDVVAGTTPAAVSLLNHTHTSAAPGDPTSPPIPT